MCIEFNEYESSVLLLYTKICISFQIRFHYFNTSIIVKSPSICFPFTNLPGFIKIEEMVVCIKFTKAKKRKANMFICNSMMLTRDLCLLTGGVAEWLRLSVSILVGLTPVDQILSFEPQTRSQQPTLISILPMLINKY